MQKLNHIGNFLKVSENSAILKYRSDLYSIDVLNGVAQFMIGICNTVITKDNEESDIITVEISCNQKNIEDLVYEFNEEVINYSFYNQMMIEKRKIRETILERVLVCAKTNSVCKNEDCSQERMD
ncbi:hypothetical protein EHE19_015080 [Ruminiclostridium herbifermentans]|uniref:His-Xaa-Ser system protein HxsD n=1 Tax=Ruminiclostridium herbifermentans TaxID=2488810 RepID=A0A4U7JHL7_9FIRM|nr:hypothetical protein [Ruminiclostridium herbifermentans]QNU66190.1 hypothetical protein EHE19_015080 [Ruminiclostridium herbifermentans]